MLFCLFFFNKVLFFKKKISSFIFCIMHVLSKSMFLISSNCSVIYLSIENKLMSFRELKKKSWVSIRTSL